MAFVVKLATIFLWLLLSNVWTQYINEFDEELRFECPKNQYISEIGSKHQNAEEDRQWKYTCRSGLVNDQCDWSVDYVNNYDQIMDWKCAQNGLVAGVRSIHSNEREDRIWKFKCCQTPDSNEGCQNITMNEFDEFMDFIVPRGHAIIGFHSIHSNKREDRKWRANVCKFAKCQAIRMRVLSTIKPRQEQIKIIGIATSQGCSNKASFQTKLENTDSVIETSAFTTEKGTSFTFGRTLSVEVSGTIGFLGSGVDVSVGLQTTFENTWHWSSSKTKETSLKTSSSASQSLGYKGPGAALIIGYVTYYRYENTDVDVEYDITCDNGQHRKQRSKASLKLDRYSQTHFVQKHGAFYSKQNCDYGSNDCIRSLNGKKTLAPNKLISDFERCIEKANMKPTKPTTATTTTSRPTKIRHDVLSDVTRDTVKLKPRWKDNNKDNIFTGSAVTVNHVILNNIKFIVSILLSISIIFM